jgi:uncharacterized membrane protein YgcG
MEPIQIIVLLFQALIISMTSANRQALNNLSRRIDDAKELSYSNHKALSKRLDDLFNRN